jgi:hypothetical protein
MGLFDRWLWGEAQDHDDEQAEAAHTSGARFAGSFEDDCTYAGPGVYYVYVADRLVQVSQAANLRHALRWTRYELSRDDRRAIPALAHIRWEATATATQLEAAVLQKREVARLQPGWRTDLAA